MKLFYGSIRKKIIILVLLATTPMLLVLLGTESLNRKHAVSEAKKEAAIFLNGFIEVQRRVTESTATLLRTVASIPDVRDANIPKTRIILETLLATNPIYSNVLLVDLNGDLVAAGKGHDAAKSLNFADRKQFVEAIKSKGFASGEFVVGKSSQKAIFPFGMAVMGKNDLPVGALIIGVSLEHYGEVFDRGEYAQGTFFGLCDSNGLRLFRYPYSEGVTPGKPIAPKVFTAARLAGRDGSLIAVNSDRLERIVVFDALRLSGLDEPYMYMFLGLSSEQAQKNASIIVRRLLVTGISSLLLALVIAWIAGNYAIVENIKKLTFATKKFGQGCSNIASEIDYNDGELGELARSFDKMASDIATKNEKVIASQAQLRTIIETIPDLIWLKNPEGLYLACNLKFERFFGAPENDIIGKSDFDFIDHHLASTLRAHDKASIDKKRATTHEIEITYADQKHSEIIESVVTPIFTSQGQLLGLLGVGRDITAHKLKSKLQVTKLNLLEETATSSVNDSIIQFLNKAEWLTASLTAFFYFVEDSRALSLPMWSTAGGLKEGKTLQIGDCDFLVGQDGAWRTCVMEGQSFIYNSEQSLVGTHGGELSCLPMGRQLVVPVTRQGKVVALLGVGDKSLEYTRHDVEAVQELADLSWDTIQYKRAEEGRRESEEKYRSMMEAMTDGAYICSANYRIEYMNIAMIAQVGQDATGQFCYMAIHNRDSVCPWCPMEEVQNGESVDREISMLNNSRSYHISNSPLLNPDGSISKVTIYRDISQLKVAEERLRHTQKLDSLGNLAGGIAHDFNNLLTPIIGMSEMLLYDLGQEHAQYSNIEQIVLAGKRASGLIKQIQSFSRQSKQQKVPVGVQQVVQEAYQLCRSTIPTNIEIALQIQQNCRLVMADPTQVHQVIMNLMTNAFHAVEETGGKITLELREVNLSGTELGLTKLTPGFYTVLSCSDNGYGIQPSVMEKIFEPYFTTKKLGRGTGLGLSVAFGIIQDHGGDIQVFSEVGKGTTVKVLLPILQKLPEVLAPTVLETNIPKGSERILLVDDDEQVLHLEKTLLENLGYEVSPYQESSEALEVFRAAPDNFDILITDMMMPGMTGDKLAQEVLALSALPIIICTGFSEKIDKDVAKAQGINGFLMKPILRSELAHMVRDVIDTDYPC